MAKVWCLLSAVWLSARRFSPRPAATIAPAMPRRIQALRAGESEIRSDAVGELVMEALSNLDPVAYVRFASVYRDFQDVSEFTEEIQKLFADPTA